MAQFIIPFVLFLAGFLSGYLIFYRRYSVERKKSREDFLTKTLNYREFEKTLAEILQNNETHIAVSLIDLDDFKSINDNYSYQEGDQILVQLTDLLSGLTRSSDLIFRFKNGDEFVIIFKALQPIYLEMIGERLRNSIENHNFTLDNKKLQLTASIGQTYLEETDTKEGLLDRLETALKRAKNEKNRVKTV